MIAAKLRIAEMEQCAVESLRLAARYPARADTYRAHAANFNWYAGWLAWDLGLASFTIDRPANFARGLGDLTVDALLSDSDSSYQSHPSYSHERSAV